MTVDPNNGVVTVVFQYAERDAAGQYDPTPATVTIPFGNNIPIANVDYNSTSESTIGLATVICALAAKEPMDGVPLLRFRKMLQLMRS